MYTKTATVKNETGLHARPASEFIACAKQFKSKLLIKLLSSGEEVNAKSIVMLLSWEQDRESLSRSAPTVRTRPRRWTPWWI